MTSIEAFAGPGGTSEALRLLGVPDAVGYEHDPAACATAEAAGHKRIQADVSMVDLRELGPVELFAASPPCQSFSSAGKGLGKLDRPRIEAHVARVKAAGRWLHYSREGWHDPRSPLVLEPLRWVLGLRPQFVMLEQVPQVLPLWQLIGGVLTEHGYSVDTGVLSAEQYGVPQTRKRAFLIARTAMPLVDPVLSLPKPTHRRYRKGVSQAEGDQSLLPWVSMADALGWGFPSRPATTVTAGGTGSGGGVEVFCSREFRRDLREVVLRSSQSVSGLGRAERPIDAPALTVTANTDRARWVGDRPATTICGTDGRITPPGHRDWSNGGVSQFAASTVRVSVQEAAVLQSFRPDYPWQGSKTKQYEQVGNAVPPVLAVAVLSALLDIPRTQESTA